METGGSAFFIVELKCLLLMLWQAMFNDIGCQAAFEKARSQAGDLVEPGYLSAHKMMVQHQGLQLHPALPCLSQDRQGRCWHQPPGVAPGL